jgi:hypothetical protein
LFAFRRVRLNENNYAEYKCCHGKKQNGKVGQAIGPFNLYHGWPEAKGFSSLFGQGVNFHKKWAHESPQAGR